MGRRTFTHLFALAGALAWAHGCATASPRQSEGREGPPSDVCAFEVVNQTVEAFNLFITSVESPTRMELRPGGRFRFERSCDVDRVVVTARPQEGPQDFSGGERRRRAGVIERTVAPQPGQLVQIALRW